VEARLGRSELCRGLAWGEAADLAEEEASSFWAADLAAIALARRSWSLSLPRFVEAALDEGPGKISVRTWQSSGDYATRGGGELPGLCFRGEAVAAPAGGVAGATEDLEPLGAPGSPSSVRMLSRRASTPATACERSDPHPERLPGVAIASTYAGKLGAQVVVRVSAIKASRTSGRFARQASGRPSGSRLGMLQIKVAFEVGAIRSGGCSGNGEVWCIIFDKKREMFNLPGTPKDVAFLELVWGSSPDGFWVWRLSLHNHAILAGAYG